MCVKFLVCILVLVYSVCGMHSSKALEGYPAGYLSDCPGSNISVPIPAKSLIHLTFTVQGTVVFLRKRKYNYFEMDKLAKDPNIDFGKPTAMYVGGYMDSPAYPFAMIAGVLYKKLGYNVLLLDTRTFTRVDYAVAARNMRTIGKHVAEMLAQLTKHGLNPKTLELLGLSLGAHTMGFIAKHYYKITGLRISRATGFDPAGPCFRNLGPEDRLDESDADFVDVVHTNIDGYGMAAPIGHVKRMTRAKKIPRFDVFVTPPCHAHLFSDNLARCHLR